MVSHRFANRNANRRPSAALIPRMRKRKKIVFIATLLGPRAPHQRRDCDFFSLEDAIAWCVKHAAQSGCGAEVIEGLSAGGKVVWKLRKSGLQRARRPEVPPDRDELTADAPPRSDT